MTRAFIPAAVVLACAIALYAEEKSKSGPAGQQATASGECCGSAGTDVPAGHRVFELRTYYANEGKLPDLHKRFRDHTCALLKKHGAELIGFWTPLDEKDGKGGKLIYLVAFPSREAATKTWEEFGKDPEWQRAREMSHKNGVLVGKVESVFLEPTDYSATR
jgi:NIPSNAP